jgi:hypothetical protein
LVSGTSIKTINGQSLLGSGNIAISVDLTGYATTAYVNGEIGVALGIFASHYLPLAGGTMTGNIDLDGWELTNGILSQWQQIDSTYGSFAQLYYNGLTVATEAYASNASNLSSGTVPIERLPNLAELIDDEVATLLQPGTDVTVVYNDAANTLTVGLGANVPRLNAANTFAGALTATQTIVGGSGSATSPLVWLNGAGTGNQIGLYRSNFDMGVATQGTPVLRVSYNAGIVTGSNNFFGLSNNQFDAFQTVDVRYGRNATGPTAETRAPGGLRVTTDGTALGPVACSVLTAGTTNNIILNGVASGIDFVNAQFGQWNFRSDNTGRLRVGRFNGGNTHFYDNGLFVNAITGLNSITLPLTSLAARPFTIGQQAIYSDEANGDFVLYDNINAREYLRLNRDAANWNITGNVRVSGTLRIGGGGTVVQNILSATATLDFPSIAASSFADLTITVTGAVSGDTVIVNPISGSATTDVVYTGWVSAANTVTIRASNVSSTTARDPASGTFRATVIRF